MAFSCCPGFSKKTKKLLAIDILQIYDFDSRIRIFDSWRELVPRLYGAQTVNPGIFGPTHQFLWSNLEEPFYR